MKADSWIVSLVGAVILLILLAPLGFSVWVSFSPDSFLTPPTNTWSLRWYGAFATEERWQRALIRSLWLAVQAGFLAVAAGFPLAWALARTRLPFRSAIEWVLVLPALIPPVAIGLGLLFMTQATVFKPYALVGAHALLGMPLVALLARSSLDRMPPEWEAAARGLGAGPWRTFWKIVFPQVGPALAVGLAGAFVISLNESMIAILLTDPATETLPAVVWPQLRHAPTPLVAVASCASVAVGILVMLAGAWFLPAKGR